MYKVQWSDHEGNLQERRFGCLEDAKAEALRLIVDYDGVQIVAVEDKNPAITVSLTPDQLAHNIDLLTRLADLYATEAAALAKLPYPVAEELAEDRLDAIGHAQELIALLAEY